MRSSISAVVVSQLVVVSDVLSLALMVIDQVLAARDAKHTETDAELQIQVPRTQTPNRCHLNYICFCSSKVDQALAQALDDFGRLDYAEGQLPDVTANSEMMKTQAETMLSQEQNATSKQVTAMEVPLHILHMILFTNHVVL